MSCGISRRNGSDSKRKVSSQRRKERDQIAEMPSLPFLIIIGALGAAAAITLAIARPLAEEGVEQMGVEPTYEI